MAVGLRYYAALQPSGPKLTAHSIIVMTVQQWAQVATLLAAAGQHSAPWLLAAPFEAPPSEPVGLVLSAMYLAFNIRSPING